MTSASFDNSLQRAWIWGTHGRTRRAIICPRRQDDKKRCWILATYLHHWSVGTCYPWCHDSIHNYWQTLPPPASWQQRCAKPSMPNINTIVIIRPPGTSGRPYVLFVVFFSFLICHTRISELPRPIAAKLCHVISISVDFIMQVQKKAQLSLTNPRNAKPCEKSAAVRRWNKLQTTCLK